MSKWIEIDADDIEITDDGVEIFVTSDNEGSVYAIIPYLVIKKLFTQSKKEDK